MNNRNAQDFLLTQKSQPQSCKNHTYKPGTTLETQPKAQELLNLMVALPSQQNLSSPSFYQAKKALRSTKIFNFHLEAVWFK